MLESYLGDLNDVLVQCELLKQEVQSTEEFAEVRLDMARNVLMSIGEFVVRGTVGGRRRR